MIGKIVITTLLTALMISVTVGYVRDDDGLLELIGEIYIVSVCIFALICWMYVLIWLC